MYYIGIAIYSRNELFSANSINRRSQAPRRLSDRRRKRWDRRDSRSWWWWSYYAPTQRVDVSENSVVWSTLWYITYNTHLEYIYLGYTHVAYYRSAPVVQGIWTEKKNTRRPLERLYIIITPIYIYHNISIIILYTTYTVVDTVIIIWKGLDGGGGDIMTTRRVCREGVVGGVAGGGGKGWIRRRRDKDQNGAHVVAVVVVDRRRTVRQTHRQTLTAGHLVPAAARAHPPGTVSSCGTPRARCTKPCLYTGRALYIRRRRRCVCVYVCVYVVFCFKI